MIRTREGGPEPWVDLKTIAEHLNCGYAMAKAMADKGEIPCHAYRSGKMTYRRFKISLVDAAMSRSPQRAAYDAVEGAA